MDELKPFQKAGAKWLASRQTAMLADEMRLGKTPQAITACDLLNAKKILVVCPSTIKYHWSKQFFKWSKRRLFHHVVEGTKCRIQKHANVIIINYELIIYPEIFKQLIDMDFAVCICDEFHYLKNYESQRTQAMLKNEIEGVPVTPIMAKAYYRWFLSGTPILNRPLELYPVTSSMAPHVLKPYNSYRSFTRHFCGGTWNGVEWEAKGATNKEELNRRLVMSGFMLRRLKKDVLDQLPDKTEEMMPIPAETNKIKELVAQEISWSREEAKHLDLGIGAEEISLVRHELALYKVKFAIKHIRYLLTLTDKVVVFAWHRDVISELFDAFPECNPVKVVGGMSAAKKQESEDLFQGDPSVKLLFGNLKSAGQGTDYSAADYILHVEGDWTPGTLEQASDRCDGFNLQKNILIQYMVIMGSLEENMLRTVIDKKKNIAEIIDNPDPMGLFT